jgi:hypothetical protein
MKPYQQLKHHLHEGDYEGYILNPIIQECTLHLATDYPRDVSLSLIMIKMENNIDLVFSIYFV